MWINQRAERYAGKASWEESNAGRQEDSLHCCPRSRLQAGDLQGWLRSRLDGSDFRRAVTVTIATSRVSATRCWTSGLARQGVPYVVGGQRLSIPCVVITRSTLVKAVALSWLLALLHASRNVGEETQNCVAYLVSLPRDKWNVIHYETKNSVACISCQPAKKRVEYQPLKQIKHTHDNY